MRRSTQPADASGVQLSRHHLRLDRGRTSAGRRRGGSERGCHPHLVRSISARRSGFPVALLAGGPVLYFTGRALDRRGPARRIRASDGTPRTKNSLSRKAARCCRPHVADTPPPRAVRKSARTRTPRPPASACSNGRSQLPLVHSLTRGPPAAPRSTRSATGRLRCTRGSVARGTTSGSLPAIRASSGSHAACAHGAAHGLADEHAKVRRRFLDAPPAHHRRPDSPPAHATADRGRADQCNAA